MLVFISSADGVTAFVKRLVGTPCDAVAISNGTLYMNGQATSEPYLAGVVAQQSFSQNFTKLTVPSEQLVVLGDNRDNSHESRFWGFVPGENVIGRVDFVWYANDLKRIGEIASGT